MNEHRTSSNVQATLPARNNTQAPLAPMRDNMPTATSPAATPVKNNMPTATLPAATPMGNNMPTAALPAATPVKNNMPTATLPAATPMRNNMPTATLPAATPMRNNMPTATLPYTTPMKNNMPTATLPAATPMRNNMPTATLPYTAPMKNNMPTLPAATRPKNNVLGATAPKKKNNYGAPYGAAGQHDFMSYPQATLPQTYRNGMTPHMDYYDPAMQPMDYPASAPEMGMYQPATQPTSIFQQQEMMPMNGTQRTSIMTSGRGVRESVLTSTDFTQGFLQTQIGRHVKVEFVIGQNMLVDREGDLVKVGTDYILIQETETDDYLLCDIYSIKFVRFYY